MIFRSGGIFVCVGFNSEGQISDRAIRFGSLPLVAEEMFAASLSDRRGYELGGAVIAAPSLYPTELSDVVRDALHVKFSPSMAQFMLKHEAAAWCKGSEFL